MWAMGKWKSKSRIPTFPQPRKPAAQVEEHLIKSLKINERSPEAEASPGTRFQHHLVLEPEPDFRIVLRLENAADPVLSRVPRQISKEISVDKRRRMGEYFEAPSGRFQGDYSCRSPTLYCLNSTRKWPIHERLWSAARRTNSVGSRTPDPSA